MKTIANCYGMDESQLTVVLTKAHKDCKRWYREWETLPTEKSITLLAEDVLKHAKGLTDAINYLPGDMQYYFEPEDMEALQRLTDAACFLANLTPGASRKTNYHRLRTVGRLMQIFSALHTGVDSKERRTSFCVDVYTLWGLDDTDGLDSVITQLQRKGIKVFYGV